VATAVYGNPLRHLIIRPAQVSGIDQAGSAALVGIDARNKSICVTCISHVLVQGGKISALCISSHIRVAASVHGNPSGIIRTRPAQVGRVDQAGRGAGIGIDTCNKCISFTIISHVRVHGGEIGAFGISANIRVAAAVHGNPIKHIIVRTAQVSGINQAGSAAGICIDACDECIICTGISHIRVQGGKISASCRSSHIGVAAAVHGNLISKITTRRPAQISGVDQAGSAARVGIDARDKCITSTVISHVRVHGGKIRAVCFSSHIRVAAAVHGNPMSIITSRPAQVSGVDQAGSAARVGIDARDKCIISTTISHVRVHSGKIRAVRPSGYIHVPAAIHGNLFNLIISRPTQVGAIDQAGSAARLGVDARNEGIV